MVTEKAERFRYCPFDSMLGQFRGFVRCDCLEFDVDTFQPVTKHIFVESRISWFHTADDLPRYQRYGGSDLVDSAD